MKKIPGRSIAAWCCGMVLLAPALAVDGPLVAPIGASDAPPAPWRVVGLPRQSKPYTRFTVVELDGRRVLKIEAAQSYGNLIHPMREDTLAYRLSWQWRVDRPIDASNLRLRSGDDSPIEVCALFDMDLRSVPFAERQVLRLARAVSGEPVPAASVCYVWDRHFSAGTVLDNAFTRRVRIIVLRGDGAATREWTLERRELKADFLRLFGGESETVPPLIGVSISADSDNTHGHSLAYLADLKLE